MRLPLPTRRRLRRALLALAGGGAVGVALVAALLVALDTGHLQEPLLKTVAARTSRSVKASDLSIRVFGGPPRLEAKRVSIGSPSWMPGEPLAEIGKLTLTFQPTFRHPLRLRTISIEDAVLRPRRDEDGRANWRLQEKRGSGGGGLLPIEHLRLSRVSVEYDDARRHLAFRGTVATGDGTADSPLRLTADGRLNGRDVQATLTGEALAGVRQDRPWHFEFDERSSRTRLTGKGTVLRPFDFMQLDVSFAAEGDDLRDLYYLIGLRLPDTGPYSGRGKLERRGARLAFPELRARSGETDIAGTYVADGSGKRPSFTADLRSTRLRSRDLGAGAAGRAKPPDGPELAIPDVRIPLGGLRRRDGEVRWRIDELHLGPLTLRNVATKIRVGDAKMTFSPLTAGTSEAGLEGKVVFDARSDAPKAEVELAFANLPVGDVFRGRHEVAPVEGHLNGHLRATGTGESLHALAASAEGDADLRLQDGTIRQSLAEILGVDLRGVGLMMSGSRQMIALRCALGRFTSREGRLVAESLVIDTEPVVIEGSGGIDLDTEAMDLTFRGRPKSMRFRLRTPLRVGGTLSSPAPRLETSRTTAQTGAAVALGALVTPVAAAAAFIDPGRARDVDCDALGSRP